MIVRESTPAAWAALQRALAGRKPRFVVRDSLPLGTMAWSRERLPLVLLSPDTDDPRMLEVARDFANRVLMPVRRRGQTSPQGGRA